MTQKPDPQNKSVDALFAAERQHLAQPSAAFLARIEADALDAQQAFLDTAHRAYCRTGLGLPGSRLVLCLALVWAAGSLVRSAPLATTTCLAVLSRLRDCSQRVLMPF